MTSNKLTDVQQILYGLAELCKRDGYIFAIENTATRKIRQTKNIKKMKNLVKNTMVGKCRMYTDNIPSYDGSIVWIGEMCFNIKTNEASVTDNIMLGYIPNIFPIFTELYKEALFFKNIGFFANG